MMFRITTMAMVVGCVGADFNFVGIGDWGGVNLGGTKETAEKAVAKQLEASAAALDAKFVVNVGDNFYYCGVQNVSDPLFQTDFEDVFTAPSTHVPWYSVLGNHDYGYSPEAQLQYKSPTNDRWVMPGRYFTRRVPLGSTANFLTMVFLDTNPCIGAYRSDNPNGWDPCSGKYMDCPNCKFHENILAQNCSAQLDWLKKTMSQIDKNDWVIVVGHHAAWEINSADLTSVLQEYGFELYMNGHTHELNMYTVDGKGDYITTGAGTMVAIPAKKGEEEEVVEEGVDAGEPLAHTHEYTWYQKVAGFTTHSFDSTFTTLTTKFVAYNGTVVNTLVTHKRA